MAHISVNNGGSGGGSSSSGAGLWGAAEEATVSGGAITVEGGKWYKLSPESGTSDDVDTINGLSEGQEVMLSVKDSGDTIVLKDGVDNLDLGGNITLNNPRERARLQHDGTGIVEASSRP